MKKVIIAIATMISLGANAQSVNFICSPRTKDTTGYIIQSTKELIITKPVTQIEFNSIKQLYMGYNVKLAPNIPITESPVLVQRFKSEGPIMMWFGNQQPQLTRGEYLVEAGKLKNLSITILSITSGVSALIISQPSLNVAEYNSRASIAGLVSLLGGGISLGVQIKSNNMLVKAGLATQP